MSTENDVKKISEEMNAELKSMSAKFQEVIDRHDKEKSELGQAVADTKDQVAKFVTDYGDKVEKFTTELQRMKSELKAPGMGSKAKAGRFADNILKSMDYENLVKSGQVRAMKGREFNLDESTSWIQKSLGPNLVSDNDNSAGQIVDLTRDPQIYNEPQRVLSMMDIIPTIPISGGVLEIMVEEYFGEVESSPSVPQKQGNAGTQNPQLSAKNKAQLNFKLKTYSPETIAGYVVLSRQSLEDVAGLRDHINRRLPYSVRFKADSQILYGSGTNGQMEGINTIAPSFSPPAGSVIDVIRFAMGDLFEDDYAATHVVLNHADWTKIETLKDSEGRYIFGNPAGQLAPRIWGLPVVPNNNQVAGTALIGNFAMGSQLRPVTGSAALRFTDSHEDLFVKNGIVMLAEERIILGNQLPNAYRAFSFPEESNSE